MSYQTVQWIVITWLIYTHVFIHPPTHSHCYVALSSLTTFRISLCTIDSNKMAASTEGFATSPNTYLQGNQKRQHTQSRERVVLEYQLQNRVENLADVSTRCSGFLQGEEGQSIWSKRRQGFQPCFEAGIRELPFLMPEPAEKPSLHTQSTCE